jgi:pimeloyl-ACP methyl ester carboxylesterase
MESLEPEYLDVLREWHRRGDDQIRSLIAQFHSFKDSYDDMNFTPPYLSTITAQTLIVHGDRDAFFPVSIPVEMYAFIPHAYLWIVPNGDHVPIFEERAAVFTQTALEFLRGEWETA